VASSGKGGNSKRRRKKRGIRPRVDGTKGKLSLEFFGVWTKEAGGNMNKSNRPQGEAKPLLSNYNILRVMKGVAEEGEDESSW